MGEAYTVNTEQKKELFKRFVDELFEDKQYITFRYTFGKPRSPKQQAALEVYFREARLGINMIYPTGYGKIKNNGGLNVVFPNTKTRR